jgi:transcriptional regulator with XRE-family HTH domain
MNLTTTLRQVRQQQRVSQLELSLRLGVSQRHVSYVESGRAQPSRPLLMRWLRELQAPLPLRNMALMQAGYAPAFGQQPLDHPELSAARHALGCLLQAHDPQPALLLDALWNVRQLNSGARWLMGVLGVPEPALASLNLLNALVAPQGLSSAITNLAEVGPQVLVQLRHDAAAQPELAERVEAYAALLAARGIAQEPRGAPPHIAPVLTTRLNTPLGELAFFSIVSTFGSPQSVTLASLRIEHLFAADEATRQVLHTHVGASDPVL